MASNSSVPLWWIVVFLALALGLGALAIGFVGGNLFSGGGAFFPLPLH